ncbi:MAG: AAA family ATPase [Candidatus Bipolaricaulaceae bacterium]
MDLKDVKTWADRVLAEVEQVIVGKSEVLKLILMSLLCGGHVLIEDFPGLAKTLAAKALAQALGLSFRRIQFTPDLLPADIIGTYIFRQSTGEFVFRPGPIFAQVVLADEINRASPRTQAALLEAMQEGQVTVEGETHRLPNPFLVIATQNPIEYEGTFPLPEAQLDRFLVRVRFGYPSQMDEIEILRRRMDRKTPSIRVRTVSSAEEVLAVRELLEDIYVDRDILDYMVRLAKATREHPAVEVGVSPRGTLALFLLSRARAAFMARDYVLPDDVKAVAIPALAHRLFLKPEVWPRRVKPEQVVQEILERVPVPKAERWTVAES